jgi:hypothetical protein
MSFHDKLPHCSDYGITFTNSANDQEFHQSKGYTNERKHCPECRIEALARSPKVAGSNPTPVTK